MKHLKLISLAIGALFVLGAVASTAQATHNVPSASKTGKMTKVPLVKYYDPCAGPFIGTQTHPIGLPVCAVSAPSTLDFKQPSSAANAGWGWVSLQTVKAGVTAASPTDADIKITIKLNHMEIAGVPYSGDLTGGTAGVRITDDANTAGVPGTAVDVPFPILSPAGPDCNAGACNVVTSVDATAPGAVITGANANIAIGVGLAANSGQIVLTDGSGVKFAQPGLVVK